MLVRTAGRGLAALCLTVITAVLLVYVPQVYGSARYLGAAFVFACIALMAAAVLVTMGNRDRRIERFGWWLGAGVTAIVLGCAVAAATVGLPLYTAPGWVWGIVVNVVVSAAYLAVFALHVLRRRAHIPPYPGREGAVSRRVRQTAR